MLLLRLPIKVEVYLDHGWQPYGGLHIVPPVWMNKIRHLVSKRRRGHDCVALDCHLLKYMPGTLVGN